MVSGILLLSKLGLDVRIRFTNGSKLAAALHFEAADSESPDSIYIADIPLDRICIDKVYTALKFLSQKSCSIHLYDHHIGWNEPVNEARMRPFFATYDVDEEKTTAAALVWRDFLKRDLRYQRWLELLSLKDNSPDMTVADDFRLLAALMQPKYAGRRCDIIRCLATGVDIDDRRNIVDWYVNEHLVRERALVDNAIIFETNTGRRIGWIDLREEEGLYANLSKLIIERRSVDLAASVIRSGVLLGGTSIDRGIDLGFHRGQHEVGGRILEVVGHKSPVRFRPIDGSIDGEFLLAVRSIISERI